MSQLHVFIVIFLYIFGNSRRVKASEMSLKERGTVTLQKLSFEQLSVLFSLILLMTFGVKQPQV